MERTSERRLRLAIPRQDQVKRVEVAGGNLVSVHRIDGSFNVRMTDARGIELFCSRLNLDSRWVAFEGCNDLGVTLGQFNGSALLRGLERILEG